MALSRVSPFVSTSCQNRIYNFRFSLEKTSNIQENVDPALLQSMREGMAGNLAGVPPRQAQENDAIPKIAPKWLKHDRQVSQYIQFADFSGVDCFKLGQPFCRF